MKPSSPTWFSEKRGFTILEVVVAMSISLVVLMAVFSLLSRGQASFERESAVATLNQSSRSALDSINRDLTMAGYKTPPSTAVVWNDGGGDSPDAVSIFYAHSELPAVEPFRCSDSSNGNPCTPIDQLSELSINTSTFDPPQTHPENVYHAGDLLFALESEDCNEDGQVGIYSFEVSQTPIYDSTNQQLLLTYQPSERQAELDLPTGFNKEVHPDCALIGPFRAIQYRVNLDLEKPALERRDLSVTAEWIPVSEHIDNLQVEYGIGDSPTFMSIPPGPSAPSQSNVNPWVNRVKVTVSATGGSMFPIGPNRPGSPSGSQSSNSSPPSSSGSQSSNNSGPSNNGNGGQSSNSSQNSSDSKGSGDTRGSQLGGSQQAEPPPNDSAHQTLSTTVSLRNTAQDAQVETPTGELDQYGGMEDSPSPNGATGFFRVEKFDNRWLFVTPDGNAFWRLGVFSVDTWRGVDDTGSSYQERILRKYGDKPKWGEQTSKRLKSWGFNTVAEYSTPYIVPLATELGQRPGLQKLAFVHLLRPSLYSLDNRNGRAPGPVKDLIAGTDPTVYSGYRRSHTPDVFDPNFAAYADGLAVAALTPEKLGSPWLMGVTMDDNDNVFGFGPGPDVPAGRLHPHIGWFALVTNSHQTEHKGLKVTYRDRKVYTKLALRDFLAKKYRTINSMNVAWGSTYTTFDSDGGWPRGKGLLDESGRSPWVGNDWGRLSEATSAVRADLDDFLYEYAKKYFSVTVQAVRKHAPNHLVFGPATMNGWGGLTRKEVLRAAGEWVDVLQASARTQELLDLTVLYAGDVPLVTWEGIFANPDSPFWSYPNPNEVTPGETRGFETQEERGQAYAEILTNRINATTESGVKPIVGISFWSWTDHWGEKRNWGLVTRTDNAYDGREAIVAAGTDPWGYPTGGEERDYGDFISSVSRANSENMVQLRRELSEK